MLASCSREVKWRVRVYECMHIVAGFAAEFVLVAEAEDVLKIRHEVGGVGM